MSGRVIQGFFTGGVRLAALSRMPAAAQRQAAAAPPRQAARPGPPPLVHDAGLAVQRKEAPGRPPLAHISPSNRDSGYGGAPGPAPIQRFGGDGGFAVDPAQIVLARGGGKPLPQALLAKMEAALGADFAAVRVHVGPQAARIGALAFTAGNDLYFAPGQYQPENIRGQQLIGHELAHVIQQRQGRVRAPGDGLFVVRDRNLEAEADRLGIKAAAHRSVVQPKFLAARLQPLAKWTRFGAAVQRSEEKRVSTRTRKMSLGSIDTVRNKVVLFWKTKIRAGTLDANLVFNGQGGHSCAARGTANGHAYTGNFHSDDLHAEMDLIENIYAGEGSLAGITSIEIEKEPCPRCAVLLNCLNLSGVVTYKKSGQKDYPTWRFPNLDPTSWEEMLGIENDDYPEEAVIELASYFKSSKFW